MSYRTLYFDLQDDVATVWLNRPETGNPLTAETRRELLHAIDLAGREARVLLLSARGDVFCAGQDFGEPARLGRINMEQSVGEEFGPLALAMADVPIPTVAAVNGLAAGPGASLAIAADICVAAEHASFMFSAVRLGLMPDTGATWHLPRLVGRARATGLALLGDAIDGRRAANWGLIWEAVPGTELGMRARQIARRLATGPAVALRAVREALKESDDNSLEAQLDLEARLQGRLGETHDFQEGIMSAHERRDPEFEGR